MSLHKANQQLTELTEQIQTWIEQGFIPTIQKQNALQQLEQIYLLLNNNQPSKPVAETTVNAATVAVFKPVAAPAQQPVVAPGDGVMLFGQTVTTTLNQQFITELFWRDEAFYDNEIRKFREMTDLDAALIYVGEKYNWAPSNTTAEKFIELLENYYN